MTLSKVASGNETRAEKAEEEKNWEGVENLYGPPLQFFDTRTLPGKYPLVRIRDFLIDITLFSTGGHPSMGSFCLLMLPPARRPFLI